MWEKRKVTSQNVNVLSLEKLERIQLIGERLTGVENRKDLLIASSTLAGSQKYSLKLTNQVTEV